MTILHRWAWWIGARLVEWADNPVEPPADPPTTQPLSVVVLPGQHLTVHWITAAGEVEYLTTHNRPTSTATWMLEQRASHRYTFATKGPDRFAFWLNVATVAVVVVAFVRRLRPGQA